MRGSCRKRWRFKVRRAHRSRGRLCPPFPHAAGHTAATSRGRNAMPVLYGRIGAAGVPARDSRTRPDAPQPADALEVGARAERCGHRPGAYPCGRPVPSWPGVRARFAYPRQALGHQGGVGSAGHVLLRQAPAGGRDSWRCWACGSGRMCRADLACASGHGGTRLLETCGRPGIRGARMAYAAAKSSARASSKPGRKAELRMPVSS
jgi:hypothetical protein